MHGLVLANPRWELLGCEDPSRFFSSLRHLAPEGAFLLVEGGAHSPPLRALLEQHRVSVEPRPALGTLWPAAPYFCVPTTEEVLERLARVTASCSYPEVCYHLHVFAGDRVLLSGYDAFSDPFYVSSDISEDAIKNFCADAACRYQAA
jgi:hypothetical protein